LNFSTSPIGDFADVDVTLAEVKTLDVFPAQGQLEYGDLTG
jgi:hypothetical protein